MEMINSTFTPNVWNHKTETINANNYKGAVESTEIFT